MPLQKLRKPRSFQNAGLKIRIPFIFSMKLTFTTPFFLKIFPRIQRRTTSLMGLLTPPFSTPTKLIIISSSLRNVFKIILLPNNKSDVRTTIQFKMSPLKTLKVQFPRILNSPPNRKFQNAKIPTTLKFIFFRNKTKFQPRILLNPISFITFQRRTLIIPFKTSRIRTRSVTFLDTRILLFTVFQTPKFNTTKFFEFLKLILNVFKILTFPSNVPLFTKMFPPKFPIIQSISRNTDTRQLLHHYTLYKYYPENYQKIEIIN